MSHTYEELKHMTVAEMRDLATENEHEALQGYSQMRKADLLEALCSAFGIEAHAHHEVVGINKRSIKDKIHALRQSRDEQRTAGDSEAYRLTIRRIHHLKRRLRKAMV